VQNALRYRSVEPVRISASAHREAVEIRVIDDGPGISADDREAAFQPFQRRDDQATSDGAGVGLGLAIARGFVEAMHGRISLDDTPGGGLTATIALPAAME
jgi:two-component system sensor histidine kinase KdpD